MIERNRIILAVGLMITTSWAIGCNDAEPASVDEHEPAASTAEASRPLSAKELLDVKVYEQANGTSHGLTPEQIVKIQDEMRKAPVFQNRFLGTWTLQNPTDAWIVMEIMYEVKPDIIVEAGTFHGGSANLWAIILEHINPNGKVITIDIKDQRVSRAKRLPIAKKRVEFLLGSSTDPKVVEKVRRQAKGKKVLVLLDSLHSKEHVAAELEAYAPLINVGSYIIIQDTAMGSILAIDEFLEATDEFVADRKRERYSDTNSVRGYLKRVKPAR